MKLPIFVNLATFFVTAAAITYAVSGIAVSERHDVQVVFDRLNEIRSSRESLTNDTLAFVRSQSPDQDRLAESCARLHGQVADLVSTLDTITLGSGELHSSLSKAIEAASETSSQVDRIRAQHAVLSNVESTLPRLIESLIELTPEKSAHRIELQEFTITFPVIARSQHSLAEQLILRAKSTLERVSTPQGDTKRQRMLELATAQIDKLLAYRRFQQTELQQLIAGRGNKVFSDSLRLAKKSVDRYVIQSQGLVRILTIASVSLIAFGCAGVWQYRGQAKRLKQLNDVLEDRVNERNRAAAEARRRSEAQLDALDRIQIRAEFDTSGIVTKVNDNFLAATGYSSEEVIGQHHQMFVFPNDRQTDEYVQFWSKLHDGDSSVGEYRRRAKDGAERWLHATYSPVIDDEGNIEKIVKYATDITMQRSIEERARRRVLVRREV
jgi:PAS domain S-box-containing protein